MSCWLPAKLISDSSQGFYWGRSHRPPPLGTHSRRQEGNQSCSSNHAVCTNRSGTASRAPEFWGWWGPSQSSQMAAQGPPDRGEQAQACGITSYTQQLHRYAPSKKHQTSNRTSCPFVDCWQLGDRKDVPQLKKGHLQKALSTTDVLDGGTLNAFPLRLGAGRCRQP